MTPLRSFTCVLVFLLAGCGAPSNDGHLGNPSPGDPPTAPSTISWFPDPSSSGAPGNRLTLAADRGIIALDDPQQPWTIHVVHGDRFQNRTTLEPRAEPLNLVAAMGPRGPVIAYRSPQFAVYVAEWNGAEWIHGMLAPAPGDLVGFLALSGSNSELVLGFPHMTSSGGPRYVLLHLTESIPADLDTAERIEFEAAVLSLGDVAVRNSTVAVAFSRETSVEVRQAPWSDLSQAPPTTLAGPSGIPSQFLYPQIAFNQGEGLAVAITGWELIGGTNPDLRSAIIYDLEQGTEISTRTRSAAYLEETPQGVAIIRQDAQAIHEIGFIRGDRIENVATSSCNRLVITPTATVVTLSRANGSWLSDLGNLPDNVPTCVS